MSDDRSYERLKIAALDHVVSRMRERSVFSAYIRGEICQVLDIVDNLVESADAKMQLPVRKL